MIAVQSLSEFVLVQRIRRLQWQQKQKERVTILQVHQNKNPSTSALHCSETTTTPRLKKSVIFADVAGRKLANEKKIYERSRISILR